MKGKAMMSSQLSGCPRRDLLVTRYLFGECMVMAATLSHVHGLPMVGIYDDLWASVPRHVGVETGSGVYGDARGLDLDRATFLAGYAAAGTLIAPVTTEQMHRIWGRRVTSWKVPDSELATLGLLQRSLAA